MNIKYLGFLLLFGLFSLGLFSQAREDKGKQSANKSASENKGFDLDKVVLGGSFGAQFGDFTVVEVSPTAGYKLTEEWIAGVGIRYIYVKPRLAQSSSLYGASTFTQYTIFEQAVLHAEFEYLSLEDFANPGERIDFFSPLVGAGYRTSFGGSGFANFLILFNLNESDNYPYSNPIFRLNFGFGL